MAMTKQVWSISGLATELGLDRRTVAGKLSAVPPDGKLKGKPAWHLETALDAIRGKWRPPAAPPVPKGLESLKGMGAADQLALIVLAKVATVAPGYVAALAVDGGAAEPSAGPVLERIALGGLATAAREILTAIGITADPASLLVPEELVASSPRWDRFDGFDPARAEALVAEFHAAAG